MITVANSPLWEDGNGSTTQAVRRAMFRKMNESFLSALRKHHGHRAVAVPTLNATQPTTPPVPRKPLIPLSVDLLDDIDEAELVQIRGILRRESVKRVVEAISEETGIPAVRIVSTTRNREVIAARHRAFYELHMAGFSLTQIGRMFHKDHTTALHGIRMHQSRNGL